MLITALLIGLIVFLLFSLIIRRKNQHELFKTLGIPGPKPHWWLGNLGELRRKPNNVHIQLQEWTKQYGKVYGYYEGPTPILVVSDLNLLKQILIKNISNFNGRKMFPVQPDPDTGDEMHLVLARDNRWKRLRSITNPTFSSAKLKQTFPLVYNKVNSALNKCEEAAESEKPFDIGRLFEALSFDVIVESAFGIKVDTLSDTNNPFIEACRKSFSNLQHMPWLFAIAEKLPELRPVLWAVVRFLFKVTNSPEQFIMDSMYEAIQLRKNNKYERQQRPDLMQLMMDAEADDKMLRDPEAFVMTTDDTDADVHHAVSQTTAKVTHARENVTTGKRKLKKKLTVEEIKMQGYLFLLAGYETTSTAMSYCAHLLATNPDKQEKLFQELDQHLPSAEEPTYEQIQSLQYLDMVICETLRLHPVAGLFVTRLCMETCRIDDLTIPAGVVVQANSWTIHYDPEIWGPTDPKIFEPQRFTPERKATRHPLAWMPFGAGPRNCVGLRFAIMEVKLALASIIKNYRIEQCPETEVPLKYAEHAVVAPLNGVTVKLVKRR